MANEVRLINYDAAIDRYYAEYEKQDICDDAQDRDWLKKCFDEAPTIDPESLRPKGRWAHDGRRTHNGVDWYHCSKCGNNETGAALTNYCPNCGAKMEG